MSQNPPSNQRTKRHVELRTGTPYANLIAAQTLFTRTLGAHCHIAPDNIIPTFGATGAIEAVRNHVLKNISSRPATVLTVTPGYWRARESFEGVGFQILNFRTEPNAFSISESAFIEKALATRPDLIYLSLPNNPTGAIFDPRTIVQEIPDAITLMFDLTLPCRDFDAGRLTREIYESFAGRSNLFLVGSTSKSHETAEYRIGWAIGTSANDAVELRGENRSGISTFAIAEAIRRIGEPPMVLDKIDRSFVFLDAGASSGKFKLVEPERRVRTTYVLIELLAPSESVRQILDDQGIHVMWGSDFGLTDKHIRLETVECDNIEIFVDAINSSPCQEA
jgi:aspartate/methionine/tyrosine aminotransferase